MNQKISRFSYYLSLNSLTLAFVLSPLFFLPLTTDFFQLNKLFLFTILTTVSLLSWLVYNLSQKTLRLTLSPLLLPLFLFTAAAIASTLLHPNPDAWINRSQLYISGFIFFILLSTLIHSTQSVQKILHYFFFSSLLVSFWGILSILGLFESTTLPAFLISKSFSPTGSPLSLFILLLSVLPIGLVQAFKSKTGPKKLMFFIGSGIIISNLIFTGYQLLPNQSLQPVILSKLASWSIAIDTLKTEVFFGTGPSNFVNHFTLFKPLSLNSGPFWQVNFTVSGSEYLHLLTTLGLAGLITLTLLILSFFRLIKHTPGTRTTSLQLSINLSIVTLLILGLFFPFTILHWIVLIAFLSLSVAMYKQKVQTKVKDVIITINAISLVNPSDDNPKPAHKFSANVLPLTLALPTTLFVILSAIYLSKAYIGEVYFRQSIQAAENNQGQNTYNLQIKALTITPQTDRYHLSYSNTNLALANALASSPDLSDQDQQTIATLIQQAIREARTATQLNPNKASNWSNLANIYRQLVNFAEGSDQFSQAAYIRAIQLDPANPKLRLDLGGLLFSLENYDQAIARFQEVIQLKPDLANAYYNLAHAYKNQGETLTAYQAMEQALSLVPADSSDFQQAQSELNELKAQLPKKTTEPESATQPDTLTQPSPPPQAPEDFKPIDLASPEPSPSPSPEN